MYNGSKPKWKGIPYTMARITEEERRWAAESDARALAEANVIRNDPTRLQAAQEAARAMAEEEAKKAAAMRTVAKQGAKPRGKGLVADSGADRQRDSNVYNVFKRLLEAQVRTEVTWGGNNQEGGQRKMANELCRPN